MSETQDIYLMDMSRCQPAEAVSRDRLPGRWRLVDYETEAGDKGVMALASPELGAGEITLPLNVTGPYQIFLGINYSRPVYYDRMDHNKWSMYGDLEIKLTRDEGYTRIATEQDFNEFNKESRMGVGKYIPRTIQESYWRTADLTGQALHLRPPIEPFWGEHLRGVANLTYVRLVPLDSAGVARWRALQPRPETRRLAFIYCAGHLCGHIDGTNNYHPASLDWFRHELAPALDGDFSIFSAEVIRGSYCCFNSQIGDVGQAGQTWQPEWVDPLAAFTQLTHEHGLKMFAAMRMIGAGYPMTLAPIGQARFFWEHPEWTKRDREGYPTTNLSLAYPEVRQYWLSLLREALAYGIDGVTLYFHRFKPFVLYEQPVLDSFILKFGEDPRDLPEEEQRWLQHRADYVTQFVREVRQLVIEQPGRELAVTFYGIKSRNDKYETYNPLLHTVDVDTWLREGLVDYLWPMQGLNLELTRHWRSLSPDVHIWPDLMPRTQPGEKFAELAKQGYAAGADGFVFNDSERRSPQISQWAVEKVLGHPDMLDDLIQTAPAYYRRVMLKRLQGFTYRYSFNNFGN